VRFQSVPAGRKSPTDRFHRFCVATVARLPWHLNSVVAPTFLGFALINGLTFGVDLLLLSGLHAGLRMPIPFAVTVAWVIFCATTFLRAGHNFIRNGEMPPGRFAVVLMRFVGGQVAMVVRSLFVHLKKAAAPPKPVVFDRTPKKGA